GQTPIAMPGEHKDVRLIEIPGETPASVRGVVERGQEIGEHGAVGLRTVAACYWGIVPCVRLADEMGAAIRPAGAQGSAVPVDAVLIRPAANRKTIRGKEALAKGLPFPHEPG